MSSVLLVLLAIAAVFVVVGVVQRLVKWAVTGLIAAFVVLLAYYLIIDNAPAPVAEGMEKAADKATAVGSEVLDEVGRAGGKAARTLGGAAKEAGGELAEDVGEAAKQAGQQVVQKAADAAREAGAKAVEGATGALGQGGAPTPTPTPRR